VRNTPYEEAHLSLEEKENWFDREPLAIILKELITAQQKSYNHAKDPQKKNKTAQSIAYLIQVMSSLINSEKNIEDRIKQLEGLQKYK